MKLIDADYITEGRVSNDPVVIAAKCAPIIPAIPVEWIRDIKDKLPDSVEKMGLDAVLMLWANEQEAE